jgi:hypothetical protein
MSVPGDLVEVSVDHVHTAVREIANHEIVGLGSQTLRLRSTPRTPELFALQTFTRCLLMKPPARIPMPSCLVTLPHNP